MLKVIYLWFSHQHSHVNLGSFLHTFSSLTFFPSLLPWIVYLWFCFSELRCEMFGWLHKHYEKVSQTFDFAIIAHAYMKRSHNKLNLALNKIFFHKPVLIFYVNFRVVLSLRIYNIALLVPFFNFGEEKLIEFDVPNLVQISILVCEVWEPMV